ncbi:glycosyltransferase [Microbacterium sp. Root61]|uniref:glycosyltransferase family 4 protein n=1 Tax=Microbacterium sp. Root61 TaxID=1736570 RepID=UPI0006F6EDC9|nr:glycosyltransferase family 4 protein [Microbacterium sp. Root61]KRA25373.1 glycosyltransferase [Microbacterium sp. Root61]
MHVVMFGDQHVESLGGAQVSMRLQRRFLEKAGHTVTIVAPAMHGPRAAAAPRSDAYLDIPSIPITLDREYAMSWPGRRADEFIDAAMAERAPVDLVHVQADFWGAYLGHRFARRHGLPVVHTMHNRVDVGIEATAPLPGLVLHVLNAWQRHAIAEQSPGRDGWAYLRRFATRSQAVTAPSSHFAHRLEAHGAVPAAGAVDVVWNGIDDEVLDAALAAPAERMPGLPRFVWLGRMSPEKRLLPFLEAVAVSGIAADIEVIGGGGQLAAARRLVARRGPTASVHFAGRLSYAETLRRIRMADAVVQTSIGFETQGMTVFEAASLGTPSIISDPDIAAELSSGFWQVADASTAALAATLRTAATDITAGTAVSPDPEIAEKFRQSSRTAAMVEVYRRALGGR